MATLSVSGLGSGIDWQSILEQLRTAEQAKITPLSNEATTNTRKISAWQSFSSLLSTLESASNVLKSSAGFDLFTTSLSSSSSVDASTLLSASASSSATKGTYQVVVTQKAQAEKLASSSFASKTAALGITGTILVNGKAVRVEADDTLQELAANINNLDSGDGATHVTASIIRDTASSYRLVLTSGTEGASGISLQNGSTSDTLAALGFNGTGTVLRNRVSGGAQSDAFSSSSTAVETLLGNEDQDLSGTVTINGISVTIDLSDSLETIRDTLNAAGLSASIVSTTEDVSETDTELTTTYRLQIEGMTGWTDENNVLQALGLIEGNREDSTGVCGSVANTSDGSTPISAETKITDIYGYLTNSAGDKITISGTAHDGTAVAATDLAIDGNTTVGDLLSGIESLFGNVTATLGPDGKIQVIDNETGTSQLSVDLDATITDPNGGVLDFGSFGAVGAVRKYVLQQGLDAAFTVDGMSMTSSGNTVTNAIEGVTLNLLGADANTAVTVDIGRDVQGIEDKVNEMLSAYNNVISYVNSQMSYDVDSGTTGGALFGDNTLKSIKRQLQSLMMGAIGSSSIKYMTDIGISAKRDGTLSLDTETFEDVLASNFDDVVKLFADTGTCSDSSFQYLYCGRSTTAGTYALGVSEVSENVTGQIDGLDATCSGNILKLTDSSSNANGLAVRYTGTTAPASATVTFTRGFASLLENLTYQLTDSIDGTVTLQADSLETRNETLNGRISDMEELIDRKMTLMEQQFQSLEVAITQMQSLASYLSSLNTSSS